LIFSLESLPWAHRHAEAASHVLRVAGERPAGRLVRSGARFAAKAMVLSAASNDAAIEMAVRRIEPALDRLRAVLTELAGIVQAPERGDHLLAHLVAVTAALNDLQIGAPGRGLVAALRWSARYSSPRCIGCS
jgi:hypothetical protein